MMLSPRLFGLIGLVGVVGAGVVFRYERAGAPPWAAPAASALAPAPLARSALPTANHAPIPDARLASAITEAIADDPILRSQGILVSVGNGVVTLAGTAHTLAADWRARRLVSDFKGAVSLTDGVVVVAPSRPDAEIAKEAGDAFEADPATRTASVKTSASGGTLTLSGTADSYPQRDLLGDIAAHVPGVSQVDLTVVVRRAAGHSDAEIAGATTDRLHEDARLDGTSVAVASNGGDTALSGVVGSLAQRDAAEDDARGAGAANVDAQALHVDWRASEEARAAARRPLPIDAEIGDAVRRWMSNDVTIGAPLPTASVAQGVVTLSGNVADFRAAEAARRDARRVSGVWEVVDRTSVQPAKRESDGTIQKQVLRGIIEDVAAPDAHGVTVTTSGARVTLGGTVASAEERKIIEADAEEVPGVVAVEDDLKVQGYGTVAVSPEPLRHRVIEAIFWDPRVEDRRVTVGVAPSGDVTLTGQVDTWGESRAAGDDALAAGAAHVINHIGVASGVAP